MLHRFCLGVLLLSGFFSTAVQAKELKLLFLGDNGHHRPADRFRQLQPVMAERGVKLTYTDRVDDLNPATLRQYDGLVVYANIDRIEPEQAKSLLDYVAGGKGFVPLHCASYCFRNNDEVVALIGGQFQRHGTGTFRVSPTEAAGKHPLMHGYRGFESWDETYVHTKHNEKDRTVLEYRKEGDSREPWTWVRTHGQGRVFYTAWGHDDRTWSNAGFQNLVERGIRWACGDDPGLVPAFVDRPEMTTLAKDAAPFKYVEANIPFYPPGKAWGTMDKAPRKMQLPVSPDESVKHMVTPVGFATRLFVAEPDLQGKPLAMAWDERGRLWVCESYDYPNELQPQGEGRDRIRICEDTDGDGKADKFTVFAEKLTIPTSIAFYRGGAIVQDGRETVYLKDTNGDGRADLRKVLVTGWGLGDTHGGVSNFQFGPDNWYYAMQGYNNSRPKLTDGREVTDFRMGFFRFKVAGDGQQTAVTELEFLRSTNNNTWGLGFSEEGLVFGSTANGNPSEFMPIPNRYYESVRGWSSSVLGGIADSNKFEPLDEDKVRQVDHHGGFTAAAGHALYTARAYPPEYWNRTAFVTEPTGHLIATFVLRPDGAGFRSRNSWNLLASNDEWTAPIMAEVGPDGNVWFIDWYNFIVQHNPTPAGFKTGKGNAYESELRDKKHGRIYRLTYGVGATPSPPLATPDDLVAALANDNLFWRRHAQRLLVERGQKDVVPALLKLVSNPSADSLGLNVGAIHALQTLHGLGVLDGSVSDANTAAIAALKHTSPGVRRNALQVVARNETSLNAILNADLVSDANPNVRLAAFLALSEFAPSAAAGKAIAAALANPNNAERWIPDAATSAAAKHSAFFLRDQFVKATAPTKLLATVAEHHARGAAGDSLPDLLAGLQSASPTVAEAVLEGFAKGWPKDGKVTLSADAEKSLVALVSQVPAGSRGTLVTLANRWGSKALETHVGEIAKGFLAIAADEKKPDADRVSAAKQLVDFRRTDAGTITAVADLITPRSSAELASGLVDAMGVSETADTATTLVKRLPSLTPTVRPTAYRVLLSRPEWTRVLVDGIEAGSVPLSDLALDQKQALASHPDKAIASRVKPLLAKGGGLPNPDRQKVIDELLPIVNKGGDATNGKAVFKKTCSKCHTHSGEGTKIGPDLTGMAVHPKHELLIHVLDPNRSVEGNFRIYTVTTDDGRIFSGLLASETKTAIELIDVEAKKHTLLRENIDLLQASTKSLMPEGVERQHTPAEIADLMEFLTQRGKFLPIPLEKYATIVSTKGMFHTEEADVERLIFPDWSPKTFEGVPFLLVDPQGNRRPNVILLHGTNGTLPPKMPKQVALPCNSPAKAIHFLSGVSGWGYPAAPKGTASLTVRLKYADGQTEDHPLLNGEHFADYIRRVDVPGSKFAFPLRGQQIRYLAVFPKRPETIESILLVKGNDVTSPVVMAVTVETLTR